MHRCLHRFENAVWKITHVRVSCAKKMFLVQRTCLRSAASPPTAERKSKNSAGPPPRTVADVVGPVEQQPQVEGQLVAKNDGEDHSVVAHLVEHLQNEPFWKRWLIGGLAVFFVALVVAAASITYHYVWWR